jgi:hypothetical protein
MEQQQNILNGKLRLLWSCNIILAILFVAALLLVDGNGRILFFSENVSKAVIILALFCGIGLNTKLMICDAKNKKTALLILAFYLVLGILCILIPLGLSL